MNQFFARTGLCIRLLPALVAALILAGCVMPQALIVKAPEGQAQGTSGQAEPAPRGSTAETNAHLLAALAHAPATTQRFAFTDWSVLKRVARVEKLTSANSFEERWAFMRHLALDEQALASSFGNNYFIKHAEMWGWDSTDLLWEASIDSDGPPLFVLRFGDDFDFAPVLARLDARGYTLSEHGRVPLYHHDLDVNLDWMPSTEFAIFNIAYIEQEKLFVLSSSPEQVEAALDTIDKGITLASLPDMRSVAAALGDVGAALLSPLGCQELDGALLAGNSAEPAEAIINELNGAGIKRLYSVLAVGYRAENHEEKRAGADLPLGVIVHHYRVAEQAQADFEARRSLAETGLSLATQAPYAELFEVVDAQVDAGSEGGANLVLLLHALGRPPQLFFAMLYQRDLLFSMCGGG